MLKNKGKRGIMIGGLSLFLLMAMLAPALAATNNITLSDLQLIGNKIMVYEVTETGTLYIGTYNSTDTIPITNGVDYTFVFKPDAPSVAFTSPTGIINFIAENIDNLWSAGLAFALLFAFVIVIVAIARR